PPTIPPTIDGTATAIARTARAAVEWVRSLTRSMRAMYVMPSPTFEIVWARNSFRNSGRRRTARFPSAAGFASVIAGLLGLGHAIEGDQEAERDGVGLGGGAVVLAHELEQAGLELAGLRRRQHREAAAHDRPLRVVVAVAGQVHAGVVLDV